MKKTSEILKAYQQGGFREKYAIDHAEKIERRQMGNHNLIIFRYSATDEYQDANGATWDATYKTWVN